MTTLTCILLIDDDMVDRQAVRRALAASDLTWELTEAANGAEGLAHARREVFDCVLLDYHLPDVDAFDLLADLLRPEGGRQAVMMLTGEGDPEAALNLMRAGALDHLAKADMTPQTLARAIRYAKARRGFVSALEEKTHALDVLNRQKSLLLSIIAHDLRNPFQVMLGMSDILSKAAVGKDPSWIQTRADGVRQAAEQAHRLMEDLFSWAQLQMNSAAVRFEEIELEPAVRMAIGPCLALAEEKGITLDVACSGVRVSSQPDMLATIVRNLTGNAIKFTPSGGRVAVEAQNNGKVRLDVRDTGVGMTNEVMGRLFKLDQRITTVGTAGEKGSGLGLLLCSDLSERLGSALQVSSIPGTGTTFSLELPAA